MILLDDDCLAIPAFRGCERIALASHSVKPGTLVIYSRRKAMPTVKVLGVNHRGVIVTIDGGIMTVKRRWHQRSKAAAMKSRNVSPTTKQGSRRTAA